MKKWMALAAAVLLAGGSVSGCGKKDGADALFRYDILSDPANLDPQLAEDKPSLLVIQNIYEGLLRVAENGKLTEGVASSYTISPDGLTYTFQLRPDSYWVSGADKEWKQPVTAHDFVFAFQRVFDPDTGSPYTEDFLCIQNAEQIIAGQMEETALGVSAEDADTLVFRLDYPNANFLTLLTEPAAMPCNEEFFYGTKGKYGLSTKAVLSNGPFYLQTWQYDTYGKPENNYLILRRNMERSAYHTVYPRSLNFFIVETPEELTKDFAAGEVECMVMDAVSAAKLDSQYAKDAYESSGYGLIYNRSQEQPFSDERMRRSLMLALDRQQYAGQLGNGLRSAHGVVPGGVTMLNKSFRELSAEEIYTPDPEEAAILWQAGLDTLQKKSLENVKILAPLSFSNAEYLKYVTQQWQNQLGFFCGLDIVSDQEYQKRLAAGDFQIALFQVTGSYNSPAAFLKRFLSRPVEWENGEFSSLIQQSETAKNLSDCVKLYRQAETELIQNGIYLPLFYSTEYLAYKKDITDLIYNPFTNQIDFSQAKNFE